MGLDDAVAQGINLKNKRKWDKEPEKEVIEEVIEESPKDVEDLLQREFLQKKYETSRTVNITGAAINGSGIWFVLFGAYSFLSDPNSAIFIDIFNELFFTNISHEQILEFIETFKAHLISLMTGVQTFLMYYQSIRKQMVNSNETSLYKTINNELGKMLG